VSESFPRADDGDLSDTIIIIYRVARAPGISTVQYYNHLKDVLLRDHRETSRRTACDTRKGKRRVAESGPRARWPRVSHQRIHIHCRRSRSRACYPHFFFLLIFIVFVDVNVCMHTYVFYSNNCNSTRDRSVPSVGIHLYFIITPVANSCSPFFT
jgi:hypothetical protein